MRDQETAFAIVRRCRKKVKRLSVKMRSGFREADPAKLLSFARTLESEGVDFITLHPRTSDIAFKRRADWSLIQHLHGELKIPVIGNGDIDSANTAAQRIQQNCSRAVMIGRAAAKKPWIFAQTEAIADGREKTEAVDIEISALNILHYLPESTPPEILRNRIIRFSTLFAGNLTFGHQLASDIRKNPTVEYTAAMISAYFERNPHERFK
jgi:tRNA-dihydrouridine synthase